MMEGVRNYAPALSDFFDNPEAKKNIPGYSTDNSFFYTFENV
jgi:hypothetical protein